MERETLSNRLRTIYWSLVAVGCGLLLSVRPVLAEDRKSTRLNSSHEIPSRMPSSA